MSTVQPWRDHTPTLDEAAAYLPNQAAFLLGERETTTSPRVRLMGTWTGSEGTPPPTSWTVDAALIEYGYWSFYRDREVVVSTTLFQVTRGGMTPDGWAMFEVYRVARKVEHDEAKQMAEMILAGLPVRVASGEM